jgi:O-antigen/teichoic acid export membrane protein
MSLRVVELIRLDRWRAWLRDADPVLVQGTYWALVMNSAGMLLGFLNQALLARSLGSDGLGLYLYVVGWANLAGLLVALEFPHAAVRYVSEYNAKKNWGSLRGFVNRSRQIVTATTCTVSLVAAVLILVNMPLREEKTLSWLAACTLLPVAVLIQLESSLLLGLKRLRSSVAPYMILRPLVFGGGLLLSAWVFGRAFDVKDAVLMQTVATSAALVVAMGYLRRVFPKGAREVDPQHHTREWVLASSQFIVIAIAQLVLSAQGDTLVVGALLGTRKAGLFGAASQFAMLVGFGSNAVTVIAQPMIADLHARKELRKSRIAQQIVAMTVVASVPVYFVLVVFGRSLLRIYGEQFVSMYPVLVILSISQLISGVVGTLLGYLFTMTANQETALRIIGASALLKIVLAVVLTLWLGVLGAAIASAVATLVRSFFLGIAAQRLLVDRIAPQIEVL